MAFNLDNRRIQTTNGGINSESGRTDTIDHSEQTTTPGLETTTLIKPLAHTRTVAATFTSSSQSTQNEAERITVQVEAPRTTVSTSAPRQTRTVQQAAINQNITAEDAVMEIEFTLKVRDLRGC